jgi:hypothetical protein
MNSSCKITSRHVLLEYGNGAIEMLMATPVLLLVLFASLDAGLSSVEKSAVRDSARSVLNDEQLLERGSLPYEIGAQGELYLNRSAVEQRLDGLALEVYERVYAAKSELRSASPSDIAVEACAVEMSFDSRTGELNEASPYEVLSCVSLPGDSVENSQATVSGYPYKQRETYLEETIVGKGDHVFDPVFGVRQEDDAAWGGVRSAHLSHYTVPLGGITRPDARNEALHSESPHRYYNQNKVLGVYLEARTRSGGLNSSYVEGALGRMYAVQVQNFHVLRRQFEW